MTKRYEFGKYMKAWRVAAGLTLHGAASVLGYKSIGTINNVEQGLTPVPVEKLHPLIKLYSLDPVDFLTKLADCEPELYERYMTLRRQFEDEFMSNLRTNLFGGRTDQVKAGEARHHGAFGLSPEFRKLFVYIMSTFTAAEIPAVEANQKQLNLDLPFPPIPDNNLNLWENAGHA